MRRIFSIALLLLAYGFASAQTTPSGSLVVKLGRDTIAVEQYTLTADQLTGTSVARTPRMMIREYTVTLDSKGQPTRLHVIYHRAAGPAVSERDYVYSDDSVQVTMKQDTSTTAYNVGVSGRPFPLFYDIMGFWQRSLEQALSRGQKEFGILTGKRTISYKIKGEAPGRLELIDPSGTFGPIYANVDKEMHLEKFDLTETTDKVIATRVPKLNLMAIAQQYSLQEKSGSGLGVLSPRDTARAEINGAQLMIDYGRPAVRGRAIFGRVVPWDSVWRTGANAATQMITDKELRFGSTVVPPGTYSLFTIPTRSSWTLIINKQHGQWGTQYDKSQDLARIPFAVSDRNENVERLTFEIVPEGGQGIIRMKWENTAASIPFSVQAE